jgi:hypothetical protein
VFLAVGLDVPGQVIDEGAERADALIDTDDLLENVGDETWSNLL